MCEATDHLTSVESLILVNKVNAVSPTLTLSMQWATCLHQVVKNHNRLTKIS